MAHLQISKSDRLKLLYLVKNISKNLKKIRYTNHRSEKEASYVKAKFIGFLEIISYSLF